MTTAPPNDLVDVDEVVVNATACRAEHAKVAHDIASGHIRPAQSVTGDGA